MKSMASSVSGRTLLIVHLARSDSAARFGVFPNTVSLLLPSSYASTDERGGQLDGIPSHEWWRQDFRRSLYQSFPALIEPPDLDRLRDGAWRPEDVCSIAGVGLLRFIREDLGLALSLAQAIEDAEVRGLRVVTDNRFGLRLAQMVREFADVFGTRYGVAFQRSGGRALRLPTPVLWQGQAQFRPGRWVRTRVGRVGLRSLEPDGSGDPGGRAELALFEPNDRGWRYSRPIIDELTSRGADVMAIVMLRSDARQIAELPGSRVYVASPGILPKRLARGVAETIRRMPIELTADLGAMRGPIEVLLRRIVARRLNAYLPTMTGAAEAARAAVDRFGVRTTFQFGHISPAGRAFMAQAQALGAETFTMPEGVPDPNAPEHRFAIPADGVLAWGRSDNAAYEGGRRIHVVGNHVVQSKVESVQAAIRARDTSPSVVLVAFGRPGRIASAEFFASAIEVVAKVAAFRSDFGFISNIHPGDTRDFWEAVLERFGTDPPIRLVSGRIYELMGQAMAVVTTHSTAGAEAIASGVPVVCIGSHTNPRTGKWLETDVIPEYLRHDAAYLATTAEELTAHLDHLCTSPVGHDRLADRRSEYARRFLYVDGTPSSAVSRIADVLGSNTSRAGAPVS